jgi:GAF domain-containing protein
MSAGLIITSGSKEDQYVQLLPQIKSLVGGEMDMIANMANISAALKEQFGWLWVGFYIVKNDELVLGPFQGPIACTRIQKVRGVCGKAWIEMKTIIVDNVADFSGHIACSSASKSEIVVPIVKGNEVIGVLDVDSTQLDFFDEDDLTGLEEIANILANEVF